MRKNMMIKDTCVIVKNMEVKQRWYVQNVVRLIVNSLPTLIKEKV